MAKNTGKVREFCQSGEVGTLYQTNRKTSNWPLLCCYVIFLASSHVSMLDDNKFIIYNSVTLLKTTF